MNDTNKEITSLVLSSIEYKIILIFIFIGTIFTTTKFSGTNHITMYALALNNITYQLIILYPTFIFVVYLLIKYLDKQYYVFLRFKSRYEFIKYAIKQLIKLSAIIYISDIIIVLICCNLTMHSGLNVTSIYNYNINSIIMILISTIKIYLTILVIGLINIIAIYKTNSKIIAPIISIIYVASFVVFDMYYPTNNIILDTLNPVYHSCGIEYSSNIIESIIKSVVYFGILIPTLYYWSIKSGNNVDINISK